MPAAQTGIHPIRKELSDCVLPEVGTGTAQEEGIGDLICFTGLYLGQRE